MVTRHSRRRLFSHIEFRPKLIMNLLFLPVALLDIIIMFVDRVVFFFITTHVCVCWCACVHAVVVVVVLFFLFFCNAELDGCRYIIKRVVFS